MNDKKDYQVLWEGFISNKRMLLNEMEGQYMDMISNATYYAQNHPELLSFKEVFGNDLRKVIPFEQKNVDKIAYLLCILRTFQRSTNWDQHLLPIVLPTTVKVKRQRQGGETYEQEQTLNQIVIQQTFKDQMGNTKIRKLTVVNALNLLSGALKRILEKAKQDTSVIPKLGISENRVLEILNIIPKMIDWWQKNQSKINQDPQVAELATEAAIDKSENDWVYFDNINENEGLGEVTSKYSIILSRAPIDVLRMSDHEGIDSCHSQPQHYGRAGSYFYCAIAEAQNQGAIAYVVKTEDLDQIDLNSKEIFIDPERDIKGIRPISRLRIKALKDTKNNIVYAVPDTRIYGPLINGFPELLRSKMAEQQKNMFFTEEEEGEKELILPQITNLTRAGGSWQDNQIGRLFKDLIDEVMKQEGIEPTDEQKLSIRDIEMHYVKYVGDDERYNTDDGSDDEDDEDNEDNQRESAEQDFYDEIRRGNRDAIEFRFNSSNFNWVWGQGPEITLIASAKIPIETSSINKKYYTNNKLDVETLCRDILYAIVDNNDGSDVDPQFTYPDAEIDKQECFIEGDETSKYLTFHLYYQQEDISSTGGFEDYITDFIRFSRNIGAKGLEGILQVYLEDNKILAEGEEGVSLSQRLAAFKNWVNSGKSNHFVDVGNNKFEFRPTIQSNMPDASKIKWLMAKVDIEDYKSIQDKLLSGAVYNNMGYLFSQAQESKVLDAYTNKQMGMFGQNSDPFSEFTEQEKFSFAPLIGLFRIEVTTVFLTEDMKVVSSRSSEAENNGAKIAGIYVVPVITLSKNIPPESLIGLMNYMYMIDEDPEPFIDLLHSAFKKAVSRDSDIQAVINKLTERRKRVIKERLKIWYKKNKGII